MEITWTSERYIKGTHSYRRFVRKSGDLYQFCEVDSNERRLDVRQGTITGEELPELIRRSCDLYIGAFYACEWPYEKTQN